MTPSRIEFHPYIKSTNNQLIKVHYEVHNLHTKAYHSLNVVDICLVESGTGGAGTSIRTSVFSIVNTVRVPLDLR